MLTVSLAKSKVSKVCFKKSSSSGDLVVFGLGDASYKAGEKAVGGQMILLGRKKGEIILPIFWRSKLIRKVCKSPKDSETLNMGIMADLTIHTANQIQQMIGKETKTEVKMFTDSLATLESVASSHQVERRMLRADIADLKQKLEFGEVNKICWLQDEQMLADILTKECKEKLGLDDLMKENKMDALKSADNCVTYDEGEFSISGRKLREKLIPLPKIPKRKTKKSPTDKKEEEQREEGECYEKYKLTFNAILI